MENDDFNPRASPGQAGLPYRLSQSELSYASRQLRLKTSSPEVNQFGLLRPMSSESFTRQDDGAAQPIGSGRRRHNGCKTAASQRSQENLEGEMRRPCLPKHFQPPLTCYFWASTGKCSKTDEQCAYAHWKTGFVADPPITFGNQSIAGNGVVKKLRDLESRESLAKENVEKLDQASKTLHDHLRIFRRVTSYLDKHSEFFPIDFLKDVAETAQGLKLVEGMLEDMVDNSYLQHLAAPASTD